MAVKPRNIVRDNKIKVIKKLNIKCSFCKKVYCTGWIKTKPICNRCRIRYHTKPKRVYRTKEEKERDEC